MAVKAQKSEEWARSVWRGTKSGTSNISLINPSKTDINNHIKREYFGSKRRSLFHSANRKEIPNRINHPPNMTTAVEAPIPPQVENVAPHAKPQELSFPLPKALHTTAHIHLTFLDTCTTVFLATSTPGDSAGSVKPMGSFVYAMPDRTNPRDTISTTLYNLPGSVEYTTRIAKVLARRMMVPVYVGCSIDPTALGLLVEEEMEGLTKIVEVIMQRWEGSRK
ncbi:hypothetical protein F9C07_1079386 [Aspergillus flavus]|uniref:Uncharacterized protein n=4 Tax=Aspergillus subgen. Circumdati TaxID=2720871 RepID=A0A7U2MQY7_ASPFN|nr:hypothetical protein Ao3042_03615 [Aspergillus oryzae 3.042]KAB8249130.1 hypothetical protein BDV35DRAFT_147791 [Aspergillus flavus]KDE81047.1 hypothetical protein AO1008_07607 [Aspergillus oryzae 100-8]QRD88238.1 hypothetical protein F9C07_1079386 [Aspergillus flavus]RMZ45810.1 hypothetical protein CA14_005618 [Aspergillus flavus]|eukprot:EIT79922.1 hypothetical protein Ao3042_03615 [Aspergillus oryzae 3.042]